MKKVLPAFALLALVCLMMPACAKKKIENRTTQTEPIKPIDPAERTKQAQTDEPKPNKNGLMPHQPEPGAENYDELKQQWVQNYPEEYQAYIQLNSPANQAAPPSPTEAPDQTQNQTQNQDPNQPRIPNIVLIPRSVFNQAPPDKQQYILAHPELYRIVED
jgi:hypothetical protein